MPASERAPDRPSAEGQLALGGLRSAEPRLGEARRARAGRGARRRRQPREPGLRPPVGERTEPVERHARRRPGPRPPPRRPGRPRPAARPSAGPDGSTCRRTRPRPGRRGEGAWPGWSTRSEPGGTRRRSEYCTGSTCVDQALRQRRSRASPGSRSSVVHGVNATQVGPERDARLAHGPASASTTSARVWPLSRCASTVSLSDSTAETTKRQPSAGQLRQERRGARSRCSTFAVKSKVTSGNSACSARATASAWPRPVEEVGVAEGDVGRAGRHLLADVGEHDVARARRRSARRRPAGSGSAGRGACSRGSPRRSPASSCRPSRSSRAYCLSDGSAGAARDREGELREVRRRGGRPRRTPAPAAGRRPRAPRPARPGPPPPRRRSRSRRRGRAGTRR